jgi:hypothetical protein
LKKDEIATAVRNDAELFLLVTVTFTSRRPRDGGVRQTGVTVKGEDIGIHFI